MKSKRQVTLKRNYHISNNDIFNVNLTQDNTSKSELRRGKKIVENVLISNFNGTSLNFDNVPQVINSKEGDNDISKYRKYCNVKNIENHLKDFHSPITFVDFKKRMKVLKTLEENQKISDDKHLFNSPGKLTIKTEEHGENKIAVSGYRKSKEFFECENPIKIKEYVFDTPINFNIISTKNVNENNNEIIQNEELKIDTYKINKDKLISDNYENKESKYNKIPIVKNNYSIVTNNLIKDYNIITNSQYYGKDHRRNYSATNKRAEITPSFVSNYNIINKIFEPIEKYNNFRNQKLIEKMQLQELVLNNFKEKVLKEQEKRYSSIDKMIEKQEKYENEKQRHIEEESIKARVDAKKMHNKILQLQILDKNRRKLEGKA